MSKKLLLVTALGALCIVGSPAWAQMPTTTNFGLKTGLSVAVLSGNLYGAADANPNPRVGLVLGSMLRLKPSAQGFAMQLEAQISGQGEKVETATSNEEVKLTYFNVPVLLRQYIGGKFYVNVGPQVGLLLGNRRSYKAADAAVVGGIGFEAPSGFVLDARLNYGFTDIVGDDAERSFRQRLGIGGLHNRVAQVTVGYLFGKK